MRVGLRLGLAVLGGALTLLVVAASSGADGKQVYLDPIGGSGAAPDITRIEVSNNDKGEMSFVLSISGQPSLRTGDAVFVDIDSDHNFATGAPNLNGADFLLNVFLEAGSLYTYKVCRWRGNWDCPLPGHWFDRTVTAYSHTLTLSFELPTMTSHTIRFWVEASSNQTDLDYAPDGARSGKVFTYLEQLTPDYDHDGLRGVSDACQHLAGGRYDRDGDGCPGPFPALPRPDFRFGGGVYPKYVKLAWFRVRSAPAKTKVTISFGGHRVTRQGNGGIAALANRPLPFGLKIRIVFTKPGWTGRYLDIVVGRSGPNPVHGGCVGPGTFHPVPCPQSAPA
jgi:hypothetical protein